MAYFGRFGKVTGISEAVMNLAHRQKELGHKVQIIVPFDHPYVDGKTVIFAHSFGDVMDTVRGFVPDIVVFNGFYDRYQIELSFYLKIKKIPYLLVFHGGASADNAQKNWLKKKVANLLMFNRFVRWAERVVYLTEKEHESSIFNRINSNYAIIPNGVNIPEKVTLSETHNVIRIVFLSRLDWHGKGLDVLYDAMKTLYENEFVNKVQFVFYGLKEDEECEKLFCFGTFSIYGGCVTGEDKDRAYRNADLFILPSRSEGMPVAVLEALSYGVPCIITPETNMAELIKQHNCGWVVNLSASDICSSIERIVLQFHKERKELFDNAIATARMFDWKKIAERTINLYSETISSIKKQQ